MLPLSYALNMWNETAEVLAGLFEALLDSENPLDWLLRRFAKGKKTISREIKISLLFC